MALTLVNPRRLDRIVANLERQSGESQARHDQEEMRRILDLADRDPALASLMDRAADRLLEVVRAGPGFGGCETELLRVGAADPEVSRLLAEILRLAGVAPLPGAAEDG